VLLFTLGVLVIAALLFGLAPLRVALAGRAELALKTSAATSNADAGKSRMGRIIVALQMTMCVVLLVGAGLLLRTLEKSQEHSAGDGCGWAGGVRGETEYSVASRGAGFLCESDEQAAFAAGRGVGGADGGAAWLVVVRQRRHAGGRATADVANGGSRMVRSNVVGPEVFRTLGVPVLAGRDFADSDTATSPHVGISTRSLRGGSCRA